MPQGPTGARSQMAESAPTFPIPFGNVELVRQLSVDRRGEVYVAARSEGPDRLCVVNSLGDVLAHRPAMREGLRAEAAWLVSRVHGNLVQIYDVGSTESAQEGGPKAESWVGPLPEAPQEDRLFFTCELVEGRDLATFLKRAEGAALRVAPELAVHIAMEVAFALEFIRFNEQRATGVATTMVGLHAGSVLLGVDGGVKLTHYGSCLAPLVEDLEDNDVGRASLWPPELVHGAQADERADVFAVAALLWQTLTGRPLAARGTKPHIEALRQGQWRPEAASKFEGPVRSIPVELDELLAWGLDPDPKQRPADLAAFRSELAAFQKSRDVAVGPSEVRGFVTELFARELAEEAAELTALSARVEEDLPQPSVIGRNTTNTLTNFQARRRKTPLPIEGELAVGDVIAGTRYRALVKLGEGGMGVVYAAEHVDIEKRVALKLLHADLLENQHVLQQFRQEARAASRIGNPYICDVTDWGEVADGRVFFVMEYLDGPPLSREIKACRRLPAERVIPILRQVAKALGAAHQKGIVHLDMKPDNVMLIERDGRKDYVKVVDFGIAGLLGQSGVAGKVMGTPEYMAPERTAGGGNDRRSDIYALGVMAYEMLAGEVPFQGLTPVETLAMHATDMPDPINERITQHIPKALDEAVLQMLQKDPLRRPQTMADVEALLCEAQLEARIRTPWDDLAIPQVDPIRFERLSKRFRAPSGPRLGVAMIAAGAVAVVAVVVALLALTRSQEPRLVGNNPSSPPLPGVSAPKTAENTASPSAAPPTPPTLSAPQAPEVEPRRAARTRAPRDGEASAKPAAPPRQDPPPVEEVSRRSSGDRAQAKEAADRGLAALESGQTRKAKLEFEAALKADPSYGPAIGGLAEVAFEQALYSQAANLASRALRFSPNAVRTLNLQGDAYFKMGQFDQAIAAYEKIMTLEPNNSAMARKLERLKARVE